MALKFHPAILFVLTLPAETLGAACLQGSGGEFFFRGECTYENFKDAFEDFYSSSSAVKTPGCTNSVDQEIAELYGTAAGSATEDAVLASCAKAQEAATDITLNYITYENGGSFVKDYYNGGTHWNTQTETLKFPSDGTTPAQVLRIDAADVNTYYDFARREPFVWPNELPQFNLDECEVKAAQCCWPQDRQANDNNGNCAKAYDDNCVDKDPGDNTDLCMVDLSYAPENNFVDASGYTFFPGDNNNGEGPIHCHGFAWANDDMDYYTRYKANNLFYVSMYDHMYKRGYVRNIAGAPMCGCVEKMPIVSRADCTQMNVKEKYSFKKNDGTGFTGTLRETTLEFQACQGANSKNNDLEAFYQQLVDDDKITTTQQKVFKKYIVGNNNCQSTINEFIELKGYTQGFTNDKSTWKYIIGLGSLEEDNTIYDGMQVNAMFENAPYPIVRRVCMDCKSTHEDIYYRRLTPLPIDFDMLNLLVGDWVDKDNVMGVDFELYSTFHDAIDDNKSNRWTFCNFNDPAIGFPRDCGPTQNASGQYVSLTRGHGRGHVAFFVPTNDGFVYDKTKNLALGRDTTQWSIFHGCVASRAVDGTTIGIYAWNTIAHTHRQATPFISVHLGGLTKVNDVYIWGRIDGSRDQLSNFKVDLLEGPMAGKVVATKTVPGQAAVKNYFDFGGEVGSTIRITLLGTNYLSLAEVKVYGEHVDESKLMSNVALGKPTSQSSTVYGGVSSRAVDNNVDPWWHAGGVTHTGHDTNPWWKVDLEGEFEVEYVNIINRGDCCWGRMKNVNVDLLDFNGDVVTTKNIAKVPRGYADEKSSLSFDGTLASSVRVWIDTGTSKTNLHMTEVQVWGRQYKK
uniref:Fucolectin tachylectin-4 pentraxin-1 domain-containing protein n=1 Tax=Leptocylindrus danicus TaxID=163516 RepID=A0A7S2PKW2_9STRA